MNPPQNPPPVGDPAWEWHQFHDGGPFWAAYFEDNWFLEVRLGRFVLVEYVGDRVNGKPSFEVLVRSKKDLEAMKRQAEGIAHLMASKLEEWA